MPTGIEETLGAIAAFIAENAALSAFSGSANPNGAGVEAGDSAAFAPSPILDVDVQEGSSGTVAVAEAPADGSGGDSGASRAPVDGDHPPPPGGVYERPAILDGQRGTEYIFTDPMVVDAGPDPAEVPAPADAPAADAAPTPATAPNRAETGVPPPPASDPPWLPAMNIVPPGPAPSFTAPPMTPAATAPGGDGGGIGVPADWADAWERNHEYSWSKLLFDKSGEQLNRDVRKAVDDWLGEWQRGTDENGQDASETEQSARGVAAATVETLFDLGFGMVVLPVLDPSSLARGILRTGVASAQGVEDIKQGRTLEGSLKITGEVSSVILTVASGAKVLTAKGVPVTPGENTVTVFLREGGKGQEAVVGAHNYVRVTAAAKGGAAAIDKFTDVTQGTTPSLNVEVVAEATSKPFDPVLSIAESSYTRRVPPEAARRMAAFADAAADMEYKGLKGGIGEFAGTPKEMALRALDIGIGRAGPFSTFGEHCATYAAAVARSGGVLASGRFGPHAMYLMFKYGGAPGAGLLATGVTVGMMGNQKGSASVEPAPPPAN